MSDSGIGTLIKSVGSTAKTATRAAEAGTKLAKRTVSAIAKTARENSRQTERRWYEGDQPTAREMLAQVGRLSESNPTRAREAFDLYNQAISDRNSPVWNPYAKATNTGAVEALAAMGVDLSGGVTKDRIDALKQYADYEGHVGVSGAPLAPTKKSTEAQNLAYWLYQLDRDEATTQKAETEWADLQQYLSDQVKLGMADDEILDGITWSKYSTLTGMDEARSVGVPTQLNRAVGYSRDAMYGVLWAARNPEAATSDMMVNAANYALGRGTMLKTASAKQYVAEDDVSNYAAYNPYKLTGGTFGKYVQGWGLKKGAAFTLDDVLAHREELLSLDKGEKVLGDMLTAVENTDKAKTEMAALKKQIKSWQRSGMSADEIWDAITAALDTDYPTLARMEEGRIKGNPIPMAGEVDFSLPRFKAELLGGAIETELYRPEENAQDLETYNPYRRRGGAFAELVSAWNDIGADGAITPEILEAHREEILSAEDGSKTYEKIQSAIKTSEKAGAELAALNEQITRLEQRGKQADEIWKRISNDFATNYPTLNKMEEKRRAGTALTTAGGVDFSMSELKRRVYGEPEPETATAVEDAWATDTEEAPTAAPTEAPTATPTEAPTAEPATEPVKKVVYTSALAAEIDKLLEGKQAKSPEAQSWYDEYGYLLGGEQAYYKDTGGETLTLYQDQRAELGQQAIDALEVDRVGEKGGYIDADTRIRHAVTLSEDVKAAQDAGVSLPEYYQAHPELTEKFDQWRAEADEARSAWQAEIEAAQQQQRDEINAQIADLYNYEQGGGALDAAPAANLSEDERLTELSRVNLHNQIMGQNIDTLMKNDAGYKAERDTLSDAIISKLNAGNAENDYYIGTGSIASALFDHASSLLDKDAKFAAAMGMTLEEFYEAYPEARKDSDELASQAIESFNQIWAQGDGEELALELLRTYNEEDDGLIDTPAPEADYGDTPEGDVSWAGALGRGARTGLWQWVNGKLEPINVFGRAAAISESRALLDSSDEYLAAQARNFSRSDYRAAIEESVENMANEADRQYWTERLTNWDGDIYNIGFDINYEALQNNINKRKKAIQADSDFVNKNGSGAERTMFNISSNLTHNLALLAENTLISSATGLGALGGSLSAAGEGKNLVARALSKAASVAVGSIPTAYTYGIPEGAEMAQSLERDYGIDPVTAATYGGAQAIIIGMLEHMLGIDKVLGSFNSPTMKAIAKVFDEDDLHALGLVGLTKNLIKNGFRDTFNLMAKMAVASSGSEAFQEGAEYLEGAGMKALAVAVNTDMSFSEAWRREANAGDLWENMKQGGMMGFLLGMASADVGLMTGQTQIYDMAAHEAGRDAANRLLRADASNMTQEEALELLDLVAADMKANPTLLEDAAADYQAAMITADKIANGALTGVDAQFEAQITEAQTALEATETAAQEADTALQQATQQQLEAEGALKAAAGDKRKAQLMQAQLKTATDLLQSAKERAETANAARDEAAQSLTVLNLEKESSQLAAFEELRSRSASLVAQIRAEKQANAEEKARQEQERQQAIDNADAHPESQIAQTQAEVAEAERAVQAAERAQVLEQRTGRSEALEQAQAALEEEEALADAVRENYGGLKQRLRTTRITLTDTQRQEAANIAGSYNQYRRSLFGTFNLVAEGGTSLDSLWQELSEQYPELFPAGTNEGDMMARLMEIKSDIFGAEGRVKAARARLAEAQKAAEAQNAALARIDNAAPEETEALLREAVSNDVLSESDAQRIGEKKGVTFEDGGFDGKAGVKLQISPKRKKQLTSIQSAQIRMLDAIANDYGLAITVSDDVNVNGVRFRGTNRMVINLDAAGDAILQAGVHESVHFIAEFNPEGFGDMVDFAREALIESGMDWDEAIERRKAEYAQQGRTLTDAQAVEEIVAETYPSMFTDEAVLHKFAMEHKSALRSIKHFFEKFWQKLTDIARNVLGLTRAGGFSHDEVFALVGDSPVLRKMYELFIESADKAGEAYRAGQPSGDADIDTMSGEADLSVSTIPQWEANLREHAAERGLSEGRVGQIVDEVRAQVEEIGKLKAQGQEGRRILSYIYRGPDISDAALRGKVSPIRSNIEYVWTFDLDTNCPKRLRYSNIVDAVENRLHRTLSEPERRNLLETMTWLDEEVPCTYCYVEGKRSLKADAYNDYVLSRTSEIQKANGDPKQIRANIAERFKGQRKKVNLKSIGETAEAALLNTDYTPSLEQLHDDVAATQRLVYDWLDEHYMPEYRRTESEQGVDLYTFTRDTSINKMTEALADAFNVTRVASKKKENKGELVLSADLAGELNGLVCNWLFDVYYNTPHQYMADETVSTDHINEAALTLHHAANNYANSTSQARKVERYAPYTSQVYSLSQDEKRVMNAHGGFRIHSSNDFRPDYIIDYMQFFSDLETDVRPDYEGGEPVGWYVHAYTKAPDFVKIFAPTGARINMSIAMYGDSKSGIKPNIKEGMDWVEAQSLRRDNPNAGVMAMVTNNDQLSFALNSPWVDMAIPFHASGMKKVYYDLKGWFDYTAKQNESWPGQSYYRAELAKEGVEVGKGQKADALYRKLHPEFGEIGTIYTYRSATDNEFVRTHPGELPLDKNGKPKKPIRYKPHFLPGSVPVTRVDKTGHFVEELTVEGHGNSREKYLELCRQYGVLPRFYGIEVTDKDGNPIEITQHPEYMKVIKETARTDTPQQYVTANFNADLAIDSLRGFVDKQERDMDLDANTRATEAGDSALVPAASAAKMFMDYVVGEQRVITTPARMTAMEERAMREAKNPAAGMKAVEELHKQYVIAPKPLLDAKAAVFDNVLSKRTQAAEKAGAYLTDVESADRRLAGYRAEESAKGIRYGLEGGTSYDLRANENADLSLMPGRGKPVQSQEKTYTELMSALNIQYTKGHRGFAARDGRVSYGNPTTGTVHATAVQSDMELPAQLSRQLNYRLHLDDIPELMTELLPKVKVIAPDVNTMTQAEQREAALAVYTRLWLYNRGAAVALAGDTFTKAFEAKLRDRGYLRAMQKAQTELTRYINAPESVRSTSMVDMDTVAQPKQKTSLGRWLEVKLADKTYAVQRVTDLLREQLGEENVPASRDPRTLLLANSNKGQNFVDYIIEEGLVSPQGDEIGSSLSSILRKVGKDKETQREFNAYWLSLHKLDRMKAERRVSYEDADTVNEAIRQYEAKHPEWKAIVEEATDWYDTFMRSWVVDTGMLSEDEYEKLHSMYPHYIPTYRTLYQSAENARNGGGTSGTTSGLREATGSDLDVFNPIVGLVENVQHLVANYKSAEVGRALVDAIRRTTDNGFIAEIVDTPENATLNKEYYDSPVTMNLAQLGRGGIQMGRDKAGNNIMTVMDTDGSLVSLQINDPLLADVLLHSQPQDMGKVFNAARRVKSLITNTATALSLGFSIPNALSDFGTAVMTGSFATNPITGAMKWLAAASEYTLNHAKDSLNSNLGTDFNTSEIYRAYKLFGALNSRYNLREHNAREELQTKLYGGSVTFAEVRDAFERSPILGVGSALTALPKLLIRNPVEWINNNIENATRYTEFRYGKNSARGSYSDLLAAGRASREVTADFSRAGTSRSLAIAKTSIPFFGAAIAGLNKSIMLPSGENRGRRAAILAKAGEIAAIGMLMGLARGLWSDDDKEFYDLLQDDYKMKYYILPLDGNGHFIRIKKSQDAAYLLADQIGEFLGSYINQTDGGEIGDLVGSAATLFKSTTDLTTIFDPLLDVRTNSTWYGTPIENYAMQQKPVGDRYNADTSPIWRGISNMVNAFGADWSPLDVEYLARQYMGSYGTILGKTLREATNGTLSARSFGQIVMDRLSGRLTIDGATANQASNIFYEGYNLVSQIAQTNTPDGTSSLLRYDLSDGEVQDAIRDAKLLVKMLNDTKKDINALWDEYSATEDEDAQREIRIEIMRVCVDANAEISDYRAAYCYSNSAEQAVMNTLDLLTHSKAKTEE